MKFKNALKNAAVNGSVNAELATKIGGQADELLTAAHNILKQCQKQVGMHLGEEIGLLIGQIDGMRFDAKAFNYEKLPEGQ